MQIVKRRTRLDADDALSRAVHLDVSPCYDLASSLRALYAPHIYHGFSRWAAATRRNLPPDVYEDGKFFFEGRDTGVGFGIVRLIPDLPADATQGDLIDAVAQADPIELAMYLLEGAGELPRPLLEASKSLLSAQPTRSATATALRGLTPALRGRFEEILRDPASVQGRLVTFLRRYDELVFAHQVDQLFEPLAKARQHAQEVLNVLPTLEAVERLTGGYTFSQDVPLRRLTLAPSLFLFPYVAMRIDETQGDALIMYGVPSMFSAEQHEPGLDPMLLSTLKAISDETRLKILQLVAQKPRNGPELVELLGLSQPTVHHHISQLRAAELLRQERTRNGMRLSLREDGFHHLLDSLADLVGVPLSNDSSGGSAIPSPGLRRA